MALFNVNPAPSYAVDCKSAFCIHLKLVDGQGAFRSHFMSCAAVFAPVFVECAESQKRMAQVIVLASYFSSVVGYNMENGAARKLLHSTCCNQFCLHSVVYLACLYRDDSKKDENLYCALFCTRIYFRTFGNPSHFEFPTSHCSDDYCACRTPYGQQTGRIQVFPLFYCRQTRFLRFIEYRVWRHRLRCKFTCAIKILPFSEIQRQSIQCDWRCQFF